MSAAGHRGVILMMSSPFDHDFEPVSLSRVTDEQARRFHQHWERMLEANTGRWRGADGTPLPLPIPPAAWRLAIGGMPITGWRPPATNYIRRMVDEIFRRVAYDRWGSAIAALLTPPSSNDTERKRGDRSGSPSFLILDDLIPTEPPRRQPLPAQPTTSAEAAAIVREHLATRRIETETFMRHMRHAAAHYRTLRWPLITSI
jgi:hypothetical protein